MGVLGEPITPSFKVKFRFQIERMGLLIYRTRAFTRRPQIQATQTKKILEIQAALKQKPQLKKLFFARNRGLSMSIYVV